MLSPNWVILICKNKYSLLRYLSLGKKSTSYDNLVFQSSRHHKSVKRVSPMQKESPALRRVMFALSPAVSIDSAYENPCPATDLHPVLCSVHKEGRAENKVAPVSIIWKPLHYVAPLSPSLFSRLIWSFFYRSPDTS